MNRPAPSVAIDRHVDFGVGGGMVDRRFEDEKVRTKLGDGQHVAIQSQMHTNISGVTGIPAWGGIDGQGRTPSPR